MKAPKLAEEINFDGLVGPTHNYTGLSWGNIASKNHKGKTSSLRGAGQAIARLHGLAPEDLAGPALMSQSYTALDDLTRILQLGSLYDFQQA